MGNPYCLLALFSLHIAKKFLTDDLFDIFYLPHCPRVGSHCSSKCSIDSTTSSGHVTCHPARVFLAGGPTVVAKISDGVTKRVTSGNSAASSGSMADVMATGGRRMTGSSFVGPPGGKTVRRDLNMSSSVWDNQSQHEGLGDGGYHWIV